MGGSLGGEPGRAVLPGWGPSLKPPGVEEFLVWERSQPVRYEFDGNQPVAMTGGTIAADRVARRLLLGLDRRLRPPCEAFGEDVRVLPARPRGHECSIILY